jgi:hypothetical protein
MLGLEAAAIRACVRWPELLSMLTSRDFQSPHMRAVFVELDFGLTVFELSAHHVAHVIEYDLWCTDGAEARHVDELALDARLWRKRDALMRAATCAGIGDDTGMMRWIAEAVSG